VCGRVTLYADPDRLARTVRARPDASVAELGGPRWNVAPSRPLLVALTRRHHSHAGDDVAPERVLTVLRWGLVPRWAKDPSIGNRLINARAETMADKPAFRSLLARHRCLVAVDGFYEWRRRPRGEAGAGGSTPYYFARADGEPLLLAGLWDVWQVPGLDGGPDSRLPTCTVITTASGPDVAAVHDRMPVVVAAGDVDRWLDPGEHEPGRLVPLLQPAPAGTLFGRRVGREVNDPRHDGPELLETVSDDDDGGRAGDSRADAASTGRRGATPADTDRRRKRPAVPTLFDDHPH
jgi:putative SOS response-associated peptidase YedK